MFVKELFRKYGVTCPEWLSHEFLEDNWKDSNYSLDGDTHRWSLVNPLQNLMITFDGKEYHFKAYTAEGDLLFDNVTTEDICIVC